MNISCYHIPKSTLHQVPHETLPEGLVWATCLRQIVFVSTPDYQIPSAGEGYLGLDCYKFCLQVICGLHSELLGETEVMGQFKNFLETVKGDCSLHLAFRAFAQSLLADAKKIRAEHLQDFGTSSYGRLAREWLGSSSGVHVIGRGHLATELMPWLKDLSSSITFHVRQARGRDQVEMHESHQRLRGDLIIAAPISNCELRAWIERNDVEFDTLIDFREGVQRDSDGVDGFFGQVYTLNDAFRAVAVGSRVRQDKVEQAELAIARMVNERWGQKLIRPFGWDDLCA